MRRALAAPILLAAAALGGCGSLDVAGYPPPAGPDAAPPLAERPAGTLVPAGSLPAGVSFAPRRAPVAGGERYAVVDRRARVLRIVDARSGRAVASAPAGVGPTNVVSDGGRFLWVTDTQGDGLLVFRARPKLQLLRRVYLPDAPYAIARDGRARRLWVTLTGANRLQELPAGSRARRLRSFPTTRQADAVAVDERTGAVYVKGSAPGVVQRLLP